MRPLFIVVFAAILSAAFVHQNTANTKNISSAEAKKKIAEYKKKFGFSCSPNLALLDFDDSSVVIPLLEGWGSYRMPVTATNDSAKIYFEQGINMYYGFHIIEALASFEKSVKFDGNFAMGYWGKALSYGPNINDFGYATSPDVFPSMNKAKELSANCSPLEKALINAMEVRFSADTTQSREYLNQLYADAMKKVHEQFPQSGDAAGLYADALMVQHPWDLYDQYNKPKPWTPAIVSVLEELVKEFPNHPGACHYYIHAIEGSEHPEKGLEVANRLGAMMPGVAHLVHMPSHIYIRSGYYKEGIEVNKNAVKSYYDYLGKYSPVANNSILYIVHNLHMEATCANMDGRYGEALKISYDTKNSFDSSWLDAGGFFGYIAQYIYMTPYLTLIRFGKWDDILSTPSVPDSRSFENIIWHYGRGLAYARMHDIKRANMELDALRARMGDSLLLDYPPAFNPGIAAAGVAEKILQGVIAEESNDPDGAIDILLDAVDREREMKYNEPRDWPHPARQYLGHALLKAKKYTEAEKIYREDLTINPNNGWSLTGLAEALERQGKKKEATATQQKAKEAFAQTDIKITASVF